MKNYFKFRSWHYSSRNPYDLRRIRSNQITYGSNSLESVGPKLWNGLPNEMKSAENLKSFKLLVKQWNGPECDVVPTVVLILFKIKLYIDFNLIRFRLVNFAYTLYIYIYC